MRMISSVRVLALALFSFLLLGGGTALASYVVSSNSQIGPNTVSGHHPPSGKHANLIAASVNATDLANSAVTLGKLAPSSVNGSKVVNGSLTGLDLAAPVRLPHGCTSSQIAKWTGSAWVCASSSFWALSGNAGTTSSDFLGTTDSQPLNFDVNGTRALRLEPTSSDPNLIGGDSGNFVTSGAIGATIGGGGDPGSHNSVTDNWGTIGGGRGNQAGDGDGMPTTSRFGTVAGGDGNTASGEDATVGGGDANASSNLEATVGGGAANTASGLEATVGGGQFNSASGNQSAIAGGNGNLASALSSTVPGGINNTASASQATVGGGGGNTASSGAATVAGGNGNQSSASQATVAGGGSNLASGTASAVGGGASNTASTDDSVVAGGDHNTASTGADTTVAGGSSNTAAAVYATVGGGLSNTANTNGDTIAGGVSNTTSGFESTVPGGSSNTASGNGSFAAGTNAQATHAGTFVWGDDSTSSSTVDTGANSFVARASGGFTFYTAAGSNTASGANLPGGSGSWSSLSDRHAKAAIRPVSGQSVLRKLRTLPVDTWRYKAEKGGVRHLGPMAQAFYRRFGLGESNRYISDVDAQGVALAGIKGLAARVHSQRAQLRSQSKQIAALREAVRRLSRRG
jgi:hypothetical protein